MHLLIEVRQLLFSRPLLDFVRRAVGSAVAAAVASIALLEEALVLAFQFPIELDSQDARLVRLEAFYGLQVRTIELRVVRAFARSVRACVERLVVI